MVEARLGEQVLVEVLVIGNSNLINKAMYFYGCPNEDSVALKTIGVMTTSSNAVSEKAKEGNGHARITILPLNI